MKCRVLQAVLITALMGIFLPTWAQKNYYVVVGAFSTEENEKEFTAHLPTFNQDTAYAMRDQKNLIHLYVLKTGSEDMAIERSLELQKAIEDAKSESPVPGNYESVSINNYNETNEITFKSESEPLAENVVTADASSSRDGSSRGSIALAPTKPKSQFFKFTIEDDNGESVPGKVHFVDFEREKDLATYTSSTYTDLINPGKNEEMALVCGIFGYKQSEKYIDYSSPESIEGAYRDENGAWVIPYRLERLEKGDVSVMYNVGFHKDAVIMLPQSKTDLDELVNMMKENPNYEITIHGHCNGKNERRITTTTSDDLFDVTSSKRIIGSAKMLSDLRAKAIRNYLIRAGIEAGRLKTYAWGGRYMLVKPDSNYASLNDRIEVEIRKD
jgi:outer membrane protein OmpA-like peptidoglycan-associated protein